MRAWEPGRGRVALRAEPVDPAALAAPRSIPAPPSRSAGPAQLRAGGRADALRARRRRRPRRVLPALPPRPAAGPAAAPPALAAPAPPALGLGGARLGGGQAADRDRARGPASSAASSAAGGSRLGPGPRGRCATCRPPTTIAGRAPAELASMDLSPARAIALRAVAREIAAGRCDPGEPAADRRLLAIPEIGPWTVQCLGPLRPRRSRLAAGRRSDLPEAGRPAGPSRPPRDGRGGRGVLRSVRALPRARGGCGRSACIDRRRLQGTRLAADRPAWNACRDRVRAGPKSG